MDLRGTGATELVALRNSGEVNGYFEQAREEVQKLTLSVRRFSSIGGSGLRLMRLSIRASTSLASGTRLRGQRDTHSIYTDICGNRLQ